MFPTEDSIEPVDSAKEFTPLSVHPHPPALENLNKIKGKGKSLPLPFIAELTLSLLFHLPQSWDWGLHHQPLWISAFQMETDKPLALPRLSLPAVKGWWDFLSQLLALSNISLCVSLFHCLSLFMCVSVPICVCVSEDVVRLYRWYLVSCSF